VVHLAAAQFADVPERIDRVHRGRVVVSLHIVDDRASIERVPSLPVRRRKPLESSADDRKCVRLETISIDVDVDSRHRSIDDVDVDRDRVHLPKSVDELDKSDLLVAMTAFSGGIDDILVDVDDVEAGMNDVHPRIDDVRVDANARHHVLDDDDARRIGAFVDENALDPRRTAISPVMIDVDVSFDVVRGHRKRLDVETKGLFIDTKALSPCTTVDDAHIDVVAPSMKGSDARAIALSLENDALFVEVRALFAGSGALVVAIDAPDVTKSLVLAHDSGQCERTSGVLIPIA
jgi:hypothetical protein